MDKISRIIWGAAALLYVLFLMWHENWSGPLSVAEIAKYEKAINETKTLTPVQRAALLDFARNDDGEEFYMTNLLVIRDGLVRHPDTGESVSPEKMLQLYTAPFISDLMLRAGYPAMAGQVVGGYIDVMGAGANPGWSSVGLVRYRSRRDMLELAFDPSFLGVYAYKQAALQVTYAMPMHNDVGFFMSPRYVLALLLFALAAFAQLIYLLRRKV